MRLIPGEVATKSIETLGHHALDLAAFAAVAGALVFGFVAGRRRALAMGITALAVSLAAFALDPVRPPLFVSLAAAAIGALAAAVLTASLSPLTITMTGVSGRGLSRRRVITGAVLALGFGGLGGTALLRSFARTSVRGLVRADHSVEEPADPRFDAIPGLSQRITPTASHYVVDIDLTDPFLSASSWRLKVAGAVRSPLTLSLGDLRSMTTIEQPILMQCISNPVGGTLIGNARWTGVRLGDILLPIEHGYPARVIFPGRYGMRSVKWLTSIEAITERTEGYWEKRGWDRQAVMRTGARFDLPRQGAAVRSPLTAAGLAYAGNRGISAVEVSSDDGQTWQRAMLELAASPFAWRRWAIDLTLPPGDTALVVRAFDSQGETQDATRRAPHPEGASGYHRIVVTSV